MKKIKSILMASILSTTLFAQEIDFFGNQISNKHYNSYTNNSYDNNYNDSSTNNFYIGIGAMSGDGSQTTVTNGSITSVVNYTGTGTSIKLGFIGTNQNRFEIKLNKLTSDNDSYKGIECAYLITFYKKQNLHPFIGFSTGLYKSDNLVNDPTAFSVGIRSGFFYSMSKSFELELAYQYRYLKWNYDNIDLYDNIENVYLGLNFKF